MPLQSEVNEENVINNEEANNKLQDQYIEWEMTSTVRSENSSRKMSQNVVNILHKMSITEHRIAHQTIFRVMIHDASAQQKKAAETKRARQHENGRAKVKSYKIY